MRSTWIILILVSIASLTILAACGGGGEEVGPTPGGLTEEEAGKRAKEIIKANDCDAAQSRLSVILGN